MPSFEMIYEEDEDVLEVTFETFDESFSRTVPLNDNIVLYTDPSFNSVLGLAFYSFSQLLQVTETHLDGLESLTVDQRRPILALFARAPASLFLRMLEPELLRARVGAPHLEQLVGLRD